MTRLAHLRSLVAAAIILVGTIRSVAARADFPADSANVHGTWKWVGSMGGMVRGTHGVGEQEVSLSIFPNSRFYFRWAERGTPRSLSHGNVAIRRSSQLMGGGPPARMEIEFTKGKMMYFHCILATYRNADELWIYPGGCGGEVYDATIMIFERVRRRAAPSDSTILYDFPEAPMYRPPANPETLRSRR